MADRIVYGQQELIRALHDGQRAITLCAGIYEIPLTEGVSFDRLGPVIVRVAGTRRAAETMGMVFTDIYPEYKSGFATDFRAPMHTVMSGGSFYGSYGSFAGSGYYGSFGGSMRYGSFGSFAGWGAFGSFGSFAGSGSALSAFGSGYISGSGGSFTGSIGGSFPASGSLSEARDTAPFPVLGYGIDLI